MKMSKHHFSQGRAHQVVHFLVSQKDCGFESYMSLTVPDIV